MQIIGLTGYAGSGKDCAAQGLVDLGWERIAFADPVRELALKINPDLRWGGPIESKGETYALDGPLGDMVDLLGWGAAKKNPAVRRFLQGLGMGVRDIFGEGAWVGLAWDKARAAGIAGRNVVVTDVRFPNEVDMLRRFGQSFGGDSVVRIVRPKAEGGDSFGSAPVNEHISESYVDKIKADCVITNDGAPDMLRIRLVNWAASVADLLRATSEVPG